MSRIHRYSLKGVNEHRQLGADRNTALLLSLLLSQLSSLGSLQLQASHTVASAALWGPHSPLVSVEEVEQTGLGR